MSTMPMLRQRHSDNSVHRKSAAAQQATATAVRAEPTLLGKRLQQARLQPKRLLPSDVLTLQRMAGNRAVQRLLTNRQDTSGQGRRGGEARGSGPLVQAKLAVGPVDDPYEREADRLAAEIAAAPRRTQAPPNEEPYTTPAAPTVQRMVGPEGGSVDGTLERQIRQSQSGGSSLPTSTRQVLEPRLGADLSTVRVHTGSDAIQLNRKLGAKAFTYKNHIFYGEGQSPHDLSLTAHEAVHTLQQGAVKPIHRKIDKQTDHQPWPQVRRCGLDKGVIQRLAYDDPPETWAPVNRIKRSGEGVEGVYFVYKGTDMIVVKPVIDPGNIEYANLMTGAITGLETPKTVVYPITGTDPISQLFASTTIEGSRGDDELAQKLRTNRYWLVMSTVAGRSIQTLPEDATHNEALEFIQNQQALEDTGRIMVADSFLGNTDRLIGMRVNLGNFFYNTATGRAATIDNDMEVKRAEFRRNGSIDMPTHMAAFEWLMDPGTRVQLINNFLKKFKQAHPALINQIDDDQVTAWVSNGIDKGLADLKNALDNMGLVRSAKGIDKRYGASNKRDYAMIKGSAQYMSKRLGGMSEDKAKEKLGKYIKYKELYNKLPKGLKWTARIWNKGRGF